MSKSLIGVLIDRGCCQRAISEVWKIYMLNAEDRVCQINKNPKIRRIWGFLFIWQTLSEAWSMYIFKTEDIARGRQPLYFIHHDSLNFLLDSYSHLYLYQFLKVFQQIVAEKKAVDLFALDLRVFIYLANSVSYFSNFRFCPLTAASI